MGCLPRTSCVAFGCSFASALVLALLREGLRSESLLLSASSTLAGAPTRGLRLAEIPEKAGSLIPPTSDRRPRDFAPSKPGACLKFIHIPKTGGTSIEQIWDMKNPRADPRVSGWARRDPLSTCTGNEPAKPEPRLYLQESARRCKVPGGTCDYYHTPPMEDPLLWKTGFEECDTFCVVRHPLDRFQSEYQYATRKNCSGVVGPKSFNSWARAKLDILIRGELYIDGCHLLPMHHFVIHSSPGSPIRRSCTHVLRFEYLEEEFIELMNVYNYSLKIGGRMTNKLYTCDLEIPPDILDNIRWVYATDYGLFGYD